MSVRPRHSIENINQRQHHCHEDAGQDADTEHAERRDHRQPEFGGAHLPQEAEGRDVNQPQRSDDDDRTQRDGGQRRQQRRQEEQEDDGQRRGDQADPLRPAAHLIANGRA